MGMLQEQVIESLTNHTPTPTQVLAIENLRRIGKTLGWHFEMSCPPSRERSLAVTKLEESIMWAVKSIVLPRNSQSFGKADSGEGSKQ